MILMILKIMTLVVVPILITPFNKDNNTIITFVTIATTSNGYDINHVKVTVTKRYSRITVTAIINTRFITITLSITTIITMFLSFSNLNFNAC